MKMERMIEMLKTVPYLAISADDLAALLEESGPVRVEKPAGLGPIRLFQSGEEYLFQETSDRGEILVRSFPTRDEANRYIENRLEIYDRMWDGCGCKVDYHE